MQKPSLGRIVIAFTHPTTNNGSDVCPAVVVRVWNDNMVNLRLIKDGRDEEWKTSVTLFATEEEARAHGTHSCFWPPRV